MYLRQIAIIKTKGGTMPSVAVPNVVDMRTNPPKYKFRLRASLKSTIHHIHIINISPPIEKNEKIACMDPNGATKKILKSTIHVSG